MGLGRLELPTHALQAKGGEASASRFSVSPLSASLPSDRCLALAFPLCAGFLVEPALSQLRVQSGSLNFALELPEGPLEVLPLLDDHFQQYHAPRLNQSHVSSPKIYTDGPGRTIEPVVKQKACILQQPSRGGVPPCAGCARKGGIPPGEPDSPPPTPRKVGGAGGIR